MPTWNSEGLLSSQVLRFCLPAIGQLAALALEKSMNHLYCDHRRILLIDQNPTKQNLRATILRNYEIEVHTASSVADAASLSRTHAYDLILLAAREHSEEADALLRAHESDSTAPENWIARRPANLRPGVGRDAKRSQAEKGSLSQWDLAQSRCG